jgi:hypothetical protein
MIYRLPRLDWFEHDCRPVENAFMACLAPAGINAYPYTVPMAWRGPPRKGLVGNELARRSTIAFDIPQDMLEQLFAGKWDFLWSPPIYLAGTGVRLCARLCKARDYLLGVYLRLTEFAVEGHTVVPRPGMLTCTCTMEHLAPTQSKPVKFREFSQAMNGDSEGGFHVVFTLSGPSDLEPYLVDGCLKLRAQIKKFM